MKTQLKISEILSVLLVIFLLMSITLAVMLISKKINNAALESYILDEAVMDIGVVEFPPVCINSNNVLTCKVKTYYHDVLFDETIFDPNSITKGDNILRKYEFTLKTISGYNCINSNCERFYFESRPKEFSTEELYLITSSIYDFIEKKPSTLEN